MTQARQFNAWEFRGRPAAFAAVVKGVKIRKSNKATPSGKRRLEVRESPELRSLPKSGKPLEWEKFGSFSRARFGDGWLIKSNSGGITHVRD